MILISVDPNNKFRPKGAKVGNLVAACGILPQFFQDASEVVPKGPLGLQTAQDVYDRMVKVYNFGDYSGPHWGTITDDGTYISSSEEDEPLDPIMHMANEGGVELFIYKYAIIAVRDEEGTVIISRMD